MHLHYHYPIDKTKGKTTANINNLNKHGFIEGKSIYETFQIKCILRIT